MAECLETTRNPAICFAVPFHPQINATVDFTPCDATQSRVIESVHDRWIADVDAGSDGIRLGIAAAVMLHLVAAAVVLPMRGPIIGDPTGIAKTVTVDLLDSFEFERRRHPTFQVAPSAAQPQEQRAHAAENVRAHEQLQQREIVAKLPAAEAKSLVEALTSPLASTFQVPGKQPLDLAVRFPPVGMSMPKSGKGAERQVSAAEDVPRAPQSRAAVNGRDQRRIHPHRLAHSATIEADFAWR